MKLLLGILRKVCCFRGKKKRNHEIAHLCSGTKCRRYAKIFCKGLTEIYRNSKSTDINQLLFLRLVKG